MIPSQCEDFRGHYRHYNYFDNVNSHIEKLGETYLAQIAGTPSATGLQTQGFVARQGGGGAPGA